MIKTQIHAEIVGHSLSPQGDELISVLCTFPRIILAEVNTHRMLSKNTSSSRAIPFNKMVEAIQNDPFIPIAWQKEHKGMQGNEYLTPNTKDLDYESLERDWLQARDFAVQVASELNNNGEGFGVTKQLCNRLLEPFMWTTMLITGSKEGWDNFFNLRCPQYKIHQGTYKSKKEALQHGLSNGELKNWSDLDWLQNNEGQAEIHMMALAEAIWDAYNESTPKHLKAGEWHIPFVDKMDFMKLGEASAGYYNNGGKLLTPSTSAVAVSVAMAARTSYTVVGEEKGLDYEALIGLHDRLLAQDPPHSSPLEHCARAMSNAEYESFYKGQIGLGGESGWCNNLKGFIPYRYMIDNNLI